LIVFDKTMPALMPVRVNAWMKVNPPCNALVHTPGSDAEGVAAARLMLLPDIVKYGMTRMARLNDMSQS
jgi:hypothetical protein